MALFESGRLAPLPAIRALLALAGLACAGGAVLLATQGGWQPALLSGLLGAFALAAGLQTQTALRGGLATALLVDFVVIFGYALLCDPALTLWRAPAGWNELFRLSPVGAGVTVALYLAVIAFSAVSSARRSTVAANAAAIAIPFVFCIFIALGSGLPQALGALLTFNAPLPAFALAWIGASIDLFVVNEAVIVGAVIVLGRRHPRDLQLHGTLALSAMFAAATPFLATAGGSAAFAGLPTIVAIPVAAVAAAAAQAGIWGETYLVTQALADILAGKPPITQTIRSPWIAGMRKGAVYGFVFIALLGIAGALVGSRSFMDLLAFASLGGACLVGAALYPLARTILESTDGTAPFRGRLLAEFSRPSNFLRGVVAGAAVMVALTIDLPDRSSLERFLFGVGWGIAASAGIDLASSLGLLVAQKRRHLASPRLYFFTAIMGAVVGGAVAWYLDAGQIAVIRDKFFAYTALDYAAAGRALQPMTIYPLFSKWGATNLGMVDGGVRLFYLESVSGVIQWIFAAPLFSINLFFLTALVKRDLQPLRTLFSADGVKQLVDNAVSVLRWGLWMAPIIYTFLKVAPTPEWYNQDGMVRTGVASVMSLTLPPAGFAQWSLEVFTALLAYDWLRVLVWFDHMGLRVATLVNLSFVGGDVLDEKASRFLGRAQKSRALPDGIRRFGTWAPLLIPFYIPRGAQWDQAWGAAERMRAATPPLAGVLLGYLVAAAVGAVALAWLMLRRLMAKRGTTRGTGVPGQSGARPFVLTNGLITTEWYDDGQGVTRIEPAARGGPPIDLTRGPDDPFQPRGKFLYFRENDGPLWSLGATPVFAPETTTTLQRLSPTSLFVSRTRFGLRMEATITVIDGETAEITAVKLVNLEHRARTISVASFREWVVNEGGVERRDPAYNAIHVGTWFSRDPTAIIAQNRLLKRGGHLSPEVAFHAAVGGATGDVTLVGYEDTKARFLGLATAASPDQLQPGVVGRDPQDQGLLYGFEPCASLQFTVRIAPESTSEIVFVDGWAPSGDAAVEAIARLLDRPLPDGDTLGSMWSRQRRLLVRPFNGAERFAFSVDGRALAVSPRTPRPYAHVLANAFGQGAVVTADGDTFSFAGNARQNALTPFRMGEGRAGAPGQAIYVFDMASREPDCATWMPLRRDDAEFSVLFEPGVATFTSRRGDLELEQSVFVPPGRSAEVKLLTLRNHGQQDRLYTVAPILEMVLAEAPSDSAGAIETHRDPGGKALFFRNPRNEFVKGWVYANTSFDPEWAETSRSRCFGDHMRGSVVPYLVEHGHPDAAGDTTEPVAAFCGTVEVRAGGETSVSVTLGQCETLDEARSHAAVASDPAWAATALAETRGYWNELLGRLRIETNRPDFDRLVNDWLPYQLLAARLWGRTGPTQRSGATGYRDQLQDVLPLVFIAPEMTRHQILLHAHRQFIEGDAVKWWHTAPGGGTGLADRTHASDPHLWLPYVTLRYVQATGDEALLDVNVPFIEADAVPRDQEGRASVPLPSRETATVIDHCWRAVEWSLARFGAHGLPLMGTGDWDDGMNLIGAAGRGESVWLGFFLHTILIEFAPVLEKRHSQKAADTCRERAATLATALHACWRGDRFIRAYADSGKELAPMSAMTSAWPALSGAIAHARAVEAADKALDVLARPDRVLLVHPPYNEHSDPFPGRSGEYPPGVRENGGQYSHGSSWFVDALARLAADAADTGDAATAARLSARAFETWCAISPLTKFDTPEATDFYGLPPHQQPADVYEGPGYEGRGGWSWYTGSAARMMSAAYAMLGLRMEKGDLVLRPDAFSPKGDLQLKRVTWRGQAFEA